MGKTPPNSPKKKRYGYFRKELAEVKTELQEVEADIEALLQRQGKLLDRKDELEAILSQSSSKSTVKDEQWEKSDFRWSQELVQKMASVFKIKQLRPMQLQTMNVTMSGRDCILIMPTGGGKSLCFQLPALLSKGVTLVVSPLVSLMEDQVMALHTYSVEAEMLNASTDKNKLKAVQDAMIDKNAALKLLYVTPEKLAKSKRFMAKLEKMYQVGRFSRLVIDEVHCCSQWGHDFRPDYKFLGIMKRQFPEVPILGLTATATVNVLDDVKKILNIPSCHLFKASFNRPNLYYEVREKPSEGKAVMDEMQKLINTRFPKQSGIVYTFSKRETEDVTAELQSRGIKAGCYHADLSAKQRSYVHRSWLSNNIHVVVATVAFGMGIDKPDVRFVIHHSLSKSMENFYQESGRAGRDDKTSYCIVFYRFQDVFRQSSMVMAEQTGMKNLYGIMDYCTDISRCRRLMIARHFGEVWDSKHCNKMCDHCDKTYDVEKKDITIYCENVIKVIDNAATRDTRLTSIKLLDAWQGKGPGPLKVKSLNRPAVTMKNSNLGLYKLYEAETATAREKLERILAHMLMKSYIQEEFHFTPYSTISYLHAGPQAGKLRDKRAKVFLEMAVKPKTPSSTSSNSVHKSSSSSATSSCKTLSPKDNLKPKLVIVNNTKSAFTDLVTPSTSHDENPLHSEKGGKSQLLKRESTLKHIRRKSVIKEDSDSESESLDFGTDNTKSEKSNKSTSHKENTSNSTKGNKSDLLKKSNSVKVKKRKAIIYDSDSDSDDKIDLSSKKLKNSTEGPFVKSGSLKNHLDKQRTESNSTSPVLIDSDVEPNGDVDLVNYANGDDFRLVGLKGSYSLTEEDKAAAVCLLDSDSDFE